jgi:predicted RecB family nuclease
MTYPIAKIDGLTANAAAKLKSVGIRTTEGLLEAAHTVKGRRTLAAKTGLGEQQLLEWANIADCMRIKGMGKAKAELLRAAGVTTVREFVHRNPERLAQAMKEANEKRKLISVLPSEASVKRLIEHARTLPLKISY